LQQRKDAGKTDIDIPCEATRIDIDRKLSAALKEWREE
jgi:hypothetical protein